MREKLTRFRWALARLAFILYVVFSVATLVGGFITAPLMTWYFFGDWRFWHHWRAGFGLLPHGLGLLALILGQSRGFMFSVPLASPPRTVPDPAVVFFRSDWRHGGTCGDCSNCCRPGGRVCPLLDTGRQVCRGYDSFYWRYFNCGRYPTSAEEIRYYDCRKWGLAAPLQRGLAVPVDVAGLGAAASLERRGECL